MARKPAHLQAKGKLAPRERIWTAIRELRRFSIETLSRRVHVHDKTVESYVEGLRHAGYVAFDSGADRPFKSFRLMRDIGIDAPRVNSQGQEVTQGRGTLALWRAMRIHKRFDFRELAAFASTDTLRVAPNTAGTYCQFLARAGYLEILRPSKPGTPACYRLAKYTGPKAPMIQRVKHLYDPNLGEVVWHPEANS